MRSPLRFACVALVLFAAACSGSTSQGESVLAIGQDQPPTSVLSATPIATTEAVVEGPRALPTALPLSEARGFVVEPTPEDGAPEATYNEAVGVPTATAVPQATPVPQATAAPQPTSPAATPQPENEAPTPTPVPEPTADSSNQAVNVANGGEVYTLNCARCHGANGLGDLGYRGIVGVGAQFGFAGLVEELTNGHPFTFGFGDKLSPQEINDVVAYVTETFG